MEDDGGGGVWFEHQQPCWSRNQGKWETGWGVGKGWESETRGRERGGKRWEKVKKVGKGGGLSRGGCSLLNIRSGWERGKGWGILLKWNRPF